MPRLRVCVSVLAREKEGRSDGDLEAGVTTPAGGRGYADGQALAAPVLQHKATHGDQVLVVAHRGAANHREQLGELILLRGHQGGHADQGVHHGLGPRRRRRSTLLRPGRPLPHLRSGFVWRTLLGPCGRVSFSTLMSNPHAISCGASPDVQQACIRQCTSPEISSPLLGDDRSSGNCPARAARTIRNCACQPAIRGRSSYIPMRPRSEPLRGRGAAYVLRAALASPIWAPTRGRTPQRGCRSSRRGDGRPEIRSQLRFGVLHSRLAHACAGRPAAGRRRPAGRQPRSPRRPTRTTVSVRRP